MRRSFVRVFSVVVCTVGLVAIAKSEDFGDADPRTGLPRGWSKGPAAHAPFIDTARDEDTYGRSSPSLRVELGPHVLNYRIGSARYPLAQMDGEYTLEVSLRVEQPDSPFLVEVIYMRPDGSWHHGERLLSLVGTPDTGWKTYRLPLRPRAGPQPGLCWILFGLPYSKLYREGRFWIDDLTVRAGAESPPLDVYLSHSSVSLGDVLQVHVSCGAGEATLEIQREVEQPVAVLERVRLDGLVAHPVPEEVWRVGCGWPASYRVRIDRSWKPGLYTVRISDGQRMRWDTFVIRPPQPGSRVLVILPTHTEQAYNSWGGRSLYTDPPARELSFERPSTHGYLDLYGGNIHLIRWLSRMDIPFDMATDDDLHSRPHHLRDYGAWIIPGHSEYWTRAMRQGVADYFGGGGNVLCLSGNTCWWQTRVVEAEDAHEPGVSRRLVCYKYAAGEDPYHGIDPRLVTTRWDEAPVNESAASLLGLSWRFGGLVNWSTAFDCPCVLDWLDGHGGYTVTSPEHWVFEGTGVSFGAVFGQAQAIVGYEVDGAEVEFVAGQPLLAEGSETPEGFRILGWAPAWNQFEADRSGVALMGILERGDAFLFNGGTTGWCWGLAHDPAVQTVTANLLARVGASPTPGAGTLGSGLTVWPNPAHDRAVFLAEGTLPPQGLAVFDVRGRLIARPELVSNGDVGLAQWDLTDTEGKPVAAGVYRARAGNRVVTFVRTR